MNKALEHHSGGDLTGGRIAEQESQRWRTGTVMVVGVLVALALVLPARAAVPDLTNGGVPTSSRTFNVGPTGFRGWAYQVYTRTDLSRQILVTSVDTNSPADLAGLGVDDVILGADGTGAAGDPALFSSDARISIAHAIADAEARSPATLKLLRWRQTVSTNNVTNTVTSPVTLALETMGTYSATAPYNCEKSSNVLARALASFHSQDEAGWSNLGALALLAANDPSNPSNALYQAKAQAWIQELVPSQGDIDALNAGADFYGAWSHGYRLLTMAEYYLQTGDSTVYPALEALANSYAMNQSWFGTTGHRFADLRPDGGFNGAVSGYGAISASGVAGFYALALAREAGVTNAAVTQAISRSDRFFASYAFKSSIAYGEHEYEPGTMNDMNGKHATAALAFSLQTNRADEAQFYGKMTTASSADRDESHAGPYFNNMWPPLGAAALGEDAAIHYFSRARWRYDLARTWDGGMVFDHYGNSGGVAYHEFPPAVPTLLTYALPLRQLYMTGRGHDPALYLSTNELAEVVLAEDFDVTACDTNELIAALSNWSPRVRDDAAHELVARTNAAALLPALHAMAADTLLDPWPRHAACTALRELGDASSAPVLAGLLTDSESFVRFGAIEAMHYVPREAAMPYINTILSACASTSEPAFPFDDDDPLQLTHNRFAVLLFHSGGSSVPDGLLKDDISGIDRDLLFAAARAIAETPAGGARSPLWTLYDQLTTDEVRTCADWIVEATRVPAPADAMFAHHIRNSGMTVMASHSIAEGVPLAEALADRQISYVADDLEQYAGSCLTVDPDPESLQFLYHDVFLKTGQSISNAVNAIVNDPSPMPLTLLKQIHSVAADSPTLTLPNAGTTLRVDATNYMRPLEGDSAYTWRKVYGPGGAVFGPNGTPDAKLTAVSLSDGQPGLYRFEVTMSDVLGYTVARDTVDLTLYDSQGQLPPNTAPTADPQSVAAASGVPTPVSLTGSDPEGDALCYHVVTGPGNGTLTGDAPYLAYKADHGYTGADSFAFEVVDGHGLTATATVSFTVSSPAVGATVYEPFDYLTGSADGLSGSSEIGLLGAWSTSGGPQLILAGSLTYASLPASGNMVNSFDALSWVPLYRPLDVAALRAEDMLDDRGELWFSVVLGATTNTDHSNGYMYFGLKDGTGASGADVGLFLQNSHTIRAVANGLLGEEGNARTVDTFPIGTPQLIVGRCVWGATTGAVDRVEMYRVLDGADGQPLLIENPVSTVYAVVPQGEIDTVYFKAHTEFLCDEIRIGPTYQSVLVGTTALVEDLAAPVPDPMVIQSSSPSIDGSSITLTAATAFDERGVDYYFTCTSGNGHDSGWQVSPVYTDSALTPGGTYTYTVMARDRSPARNMTAASAPVQVTLGALAPVPVVTGVSQASAEAILAAAGFSVGTVFVANSGQVPDGAVLGQTPAGATTAPRGTGIDLVVVQDQTAPSPNPATFATPPHAVNDSTVVMTATVGHDASGVVEYLFTETSGNSGGTSSGWQTDATYTDTGLTAVTAYSYTVSLRDALGNVGVSSSALTATPAIQPVLMVEDFEERALGDLSGQNGWVADGVQVQGDVVRDMQAASLLPDPADTHDMHRTVSQGLSELWTELFVRPELQAGVLVPPAGSAYAVSFTTNLHPVVYDGASPVELTGTTIATGGWTRVTIHTDRATKTWDLYIDGALAASDLAFYDDSAVNSNTLVGVRGRHENDAYVDDVALLQDSPLMAPVAPTGVTATLGDGTVALSWEATAGAVTYTVKRSIAPGGPYTTLAATRSLYLIDTNASAGIVHYYVVAAANASGDGGDSAEVSALIALTPPAAPADLAAVPDDSQVALSWTASVGATGYSVKRATDVGGAYTTIATPSGTSHVDLTALLGTRYFYKVTAESAGGESDDSAVVTATLLVLPSVPGSVTATAGAGKVDLNWSASANAAGYYVKRSVSQGGPYTTVAFPSGTSFTDAGLSNMTPYYYVISAASLGGESLDSAEVSATPAAVPSPPVGLSATGGDAVVELVWTAHPEATSYAVKRASVSGGPYATIGSSPSAAYSDATAINGETYYYVVAGVNASGEGDVSPEVVASPWHAVPFVENFEGLSVGDLAGQNGWGGEGAVVQTAVAIDTQAASITSGVGYVHHTFAGGETNVWTDMMIQPVPGNDAAVELPAGATFFVYASSNGNWVAFDGTNAVALTNTVATGVWTRVTVNSDYSVKTWDLYLDGVLAASALGFIDATATAFEWCGVKGAGKSQTHVDDLLLTTSSPLIAGNAAPTVDVGTNQAVALGGGATWSPNALSSTLVWLDASDSGTLWQDTAGTIPATAATRVYRWDDKSGNGHHVKSVYGGTSVPETGTRTINGKNALDFTESIMRSDTNPFGSTINDASAFIVINRDQDEHLKDDFFTLNQDTWGICTMHYDNPNTMLLGESNDSSIGLRSITPGYAMDTGQTTLISLYDSPTDNVRELRLFGKMPTEDVDVLASSTDQPTTSGGATTVTQDWMGVGHHRDLDGTRYDGLFAEVVVLNGTVSEADRQKLEGYLAHKWGFQAELGADHPYKTAAPGAANATATLDGTVSDADGDPLTTDWALTSGPSVPAFGDSSAVDTTATFDTEGTYVLRLTADDGTDQAFDELTVTVTAAGGNTAPAWTSDPINEVDATEDVAYSAALGDDASDADSDPLSFAKVAGPAWLSVAVDGALTGTPGNSDVGVNAFTVSVSDGIASPVQATLQITVDDVVPAAPTGLSALDGIGSVSLDWADSPEPDVVSYTVYRSTTSGSGYAAIATGLTASDYVDNTVVNHTIYYYVVTAVDDRSNGSMISAESSAQPGLVENLAVSDAAVQGTVSGSVSDMDISDNTYQTITEVVSGSTSAVEHKWLFSLEQAEVATFYVEAFHTANTEGDDFLFAYSTNDVDYVGMLLETRITDDNLAAYFALPAGVGGTVYIRVMDADRTDGSTQIDSISIDEMLIISEESTTAPTAAASPLPVNGAADVPVNALLSWHAGEMTASHDVYFGTSTTPAFLGNQADTVFDPGVLLNSTTYYWAIDEINNSGATVGPLWSLTTEATPNQAPSFTSDPINRSDATENVPYSDSIAGSATDPEGDPLTYSKVSGPTWLSVASDGTLAGTPVAGDVGVNSWTVQVSDGNAGTATLTITVQAGLPLPGTASNPSPSHRARDISLAPALNWTAGSNAASHNVYFGTVSGNLPFQGNQTGTTFSPGSLSGKTKYYWRIDEVNASGTTTGSEWYFTTVR